MVGSGSTDAGRDGRLRNAHVRVFLGNPSSVPSDAARTHILEEPPAVDLPAGCCVPGAARVDSGWQPGCEGRVTGSAGFYNGLRDGEQDRVPYESGKLPYRTAGSETLLEIRLQSARPDRKSGTRRPTPSSGSGYAPVGVISSRPRSNATPRNQYFSYG
jgi:hypothetical protein